MLGHLLPVLLTSLMHSNLQTLTMADALMPQLVQLVLYTSQVGLTCSLHTSLCHRRHDNTAAIFCQENLQVLNNKQACYGTDFICLCDLITSSGLASVGC